MTLLKELIVIIGAICLVMTIVAYHAKAYFQFRFEKQTRNLSNDALVQRLLMAPVLFYSMLFPFFYGSSTADLSPQASQTKKRIQLCVKIFWLSIAGLLVVALLDSIFSALK